MPTDLPLRVTDLHVDRGGAPILRGVDLTVAPGEVVALLGENGSGKSTLLQAALGLLPAAAGTVELFGAPPNRRGEVPWDRVGYVPQRAGAAAGIPVTATEVVRTGLLTGNRLAPPRGARARVLEALDAVGMADRAHQPVAQMSGGQAQRVSIARALVRRPDLLVLDEPAAGVDQPTQRSLATLLGALATSGRSILVVLHELGPFRPLIDRAVVLRAGLVVHDGDLPADEPDTHDHCEPEHEEPEALAQEGWFA